MRVCIRATACVRWKVPQPPVCRHWAAPACTSFPRTQRGSDRLTDIPHRDQTKPRRRGQLPGPAGRNQALGKAQPPDLADPLAQLADYVMTASNREQLEARAITAARSAAGSSRLKPPMMFRYASQAETFRPPRFSSTASSMAKRL